jgi:ABC-type antimicrobial peptide transport system permease subunit
MLRYTEQGMKSIHESPARLDAAKKAFQAAGGELKQWYLALGKYDAFVVAEAPDDETAATILRYSGSVKTRTVSLRTFPSLPIESIMRARHALKVDKPNDFDFMTSDSILSMISQVTQYIYLGLVVLSSIALMVGGIGVMAIMMISVTERTREIGVRKALGATTGQIQRQFFLEGFVLTMISGALGFVVALTLCALINQLPMPGRFQGMILTWQSGTAAVAVLTLIGVITATYPARRAALLPPVEALRFET